MGFKKGTRKADPQKADQGQSVRMADESTAEQDGEPPAGDRKKFLAIAALGLVLLLGGGATAGWFLGFFGGARAVEEAAGAGPPIARQRKGPVVFVDLPDILVNLHSLGQRARFLKLKVAVEVENEAAAGEIAVLMPRVLDSFQAYLRALTVDEVSNAGSLQRLKEELTARVNLALAPIRVDDVLIKEMLVQ